jgi:hypothetical protein
VGAGLVFVYGLWLWLFRDRWLHPTGFADDYRYLAQSKDWPTTWRHLFTPFNEHLVVPTRLWTYGVVRAAGDSDPAPFLAATAACFFVPTLLLAFLFFRRVGRTDEWGLIGAALFSLTLCYDEVVGWYSATQWLIPFNMLIGSLLLVECSSLRHFVFAPILAFAAPFSFSIGMLVGPLSAVWAIGRGISSRRAALCFVSGLAGSAIASLLIAQRMRESDYWLEGGKGAWSAFDPAGGAVYAVRLSVDRLVLTNLGWRATAAPLPAVGVLFPLFFLIGTLVLHRRPAVWRLYPALLVIVAGYASTLPFRTWEKYLVIINWTRYQLVPYLGLVALVVGAGATFFPGARLAWGRRSILFAIVVAGWTMLQGRGKL